MTLSPPPFPSVPAVEQIGEPIVSEARDVTNPRCAYEPGEPHISGRSAPDLDRAVHAGGKPPLGVNRVQPAPYIVDPGAEAGQCFGFKVDIAKLDPARARRAYQPIALPIDASS